MEYVIVLSSLEVLDYFFYGEFFKGDFNSSKAPQVSVANKNHNFNK
jgi:hypothetical protein